MYISNIESFLWLVFKISVVIITVKLLLDKISSFLVSPDKPPQEETKSVHDKLASHIEELSGEQTGTGHDPEGHKNKALKRLKHGKDPQAVSAAYTGLFSHQEKREKRKIGDILLENHFVSKDILDKALEHQKVYGTSLTQYLLHFGYIDEKQLAHCLSSQFGVPYLPLESYNISKEIISLIPPDIAEKYWIVPVDRQGDILTIVMIDPLNEHIIKELEQHTGLKIIPFVGIISEVLASLQTYYKVYLKDKKAEAPFFMVNHKNYVGAERRTSIRYRTSIDIQYPVQGSYLKSHTIDVSRGGFLFRSKVAVPVGSILPLEINLPPEVNDMPILAVTKVVRCASTKDDDFSIGLMLLKISKQDIDIIVNYAVEHHEDEKNAAKHPS